MTSPPVGTRASLGVQVLGDDLNLLIQPIQLGVIGGVVALGASDSELGVSTTSAFDEDGNLLEAWDEHMATLRFGLRAKTVGLPSMMPSMIFDDSFDDAFEGDVLVWICLCSFWGCGC